MPFIAPLIGAAIGGIAATAIGQAVIGAALSVGMAALSRRLTPRPSSEVAQRSAHLRLSVDAEMPRTIIIGEAATAGSLVYHNTYASTAGLELIFALADHECEAMTGVWINGRPATWDAGTGLVTEFPGMLLRFHSGAWSQAADSDAIDNSSGRWTSAHRGRGICYVYARMSYDADLYKGRTPSFLFKVKGAKLYDWRKDSTAGGSGAHRWGTPSTYEWSDNPVVGWYNYRRGIHVNGVRVAGMATPADAIPLADATAAANACDETVGLDAGGSEKRYRASAVIVTAQKHREVIRDFVAAAAGEEIDTGGEIRFAPGVAQSSVMSMTDADLMANADVEHSGAFGRKDLVNAVFGSARDPAQRYEALTLPPRLSPADEADDGARQEARYDLDFVSSLTQGQRVLEILRRRARRMLTVKATFRSKACVLDPGDWIDWTSDRYGWTAKTFEIVSCQVARDLTTEVVLREIDAGVYSWTPATDELAIGEVPDLPAGNGGIVALSGLALANITVDAGLSAASRPGLKLTWTPVTDPSVVEIEIEVRRQGDADPIGTRRAFDPGAGQYSWIDGIIGSTVYQVRARPVTLPERTTTWSGWITAPAAADRQVVEIGAEDIPDDAVTPEKLDAQTRFELSLTTAVDGVIGGMGDRASREFDMANRAGEEALRNAIQFHGVAASIRTEQIARATADGAIASQVTAVQTTVNGHTATIAQQQTSIDGMAARWAVVIDVDGRVVGRVKLDGTATQSTFDVEVDTFRVSKAGAGGAPVPVFAISTVGGVSKIVFRGDMYADGSITAAKLNVSELAALTANLGTVTAGRILSPDGKVDINLTGTNRYIKMVA